MSSIKLSPNASGTGEFTIAAPNSNTNRTLTLPDQTGTVLTNAGPFTANASASAGAVTIDASNNVGIGTGSPTDKVKVVGGNVQVPRDSLLGSSATGNAIVVGTSGGSHIKFVQNGSDDELAFITHKNGVSHAERARITSGGRLNIGTAGGSATRLEIEGGETQCVFINTSATDANYKTTMAFTDSGGTTRGTIRVNNSATQYNTSSDYRLKENIQPMTGALAKVQALKPCTFNWKIDGAAGEGFIAHELAEVAPDAVAGEKDAVETYTDKDGNEQTRPVYQGIDTSFLVATLTAAIQELNAKVAALEARLASDGPSNGGQA